MPHPIHCVVANAGGKKRTRGLINPAGQQAGLHVTTAHSCHTHTYAVCSRKPTTSGCWAAEKLALSSCSQRHRRRPLLIPTRLKRPLRLSSCTRSHHRTAPESAPPHVHYLNRGIVDRRHRKVRVVRQKEESLSSSSSFSSSTFLADSSLLLRAKVQKRRQLKRLWPVGC